MSKQVCVCLALVLGMATCSLGDATWQGSGDFCDMGNWNETPENAETYIDANGMTGASCSITVAKLKGPSYENENITAELNSGAVTVTTYCRIAYYAAGGHLIISGGTLDARCDDDGVGSPGFAVGLDFAGTLTVTAGAVRAKNLSVASQKGEAGHTYAGGTSTVNLQGGVIEADALQSKNPGSASFIISGSGVLVLPGEQSLGDLPAWVTFEGGQGQAEYDTPEYAGKTKFSVGGELTDCDGDGVPDGQDNCECIANADQADADSDGVGDVCDRCPDDADKTNPGVCGCGEADDDSDGDGVADCDDPCPDDPADECGEECTCKADMNDDGQIDLEDLQAIADILLAEGTPFIAPCE